MKTYRLTLACEQDGAIAFDHFAIPESSVAAIVGFLKENRELVRTAASAVKAARGAADMAKGIEAILYEGIRHRSRR